MAEIDETTGNVAAAHTAVSEPSRPAGSASQPASAKSAMRRKVIGRGQTSLSSPSRIVLPEPAAPVVSVKAEPEIAPVSQVQATAPSEPQVEHAAAQTPDAPASIKRSVGRPRKLAIAAATPGPARTDAAKRSAKPMPIEPVAPKPVHAKLPVTAVAAVPPAPATSSVPATKVAVTRPALRAPRVAATRIAEPRITKPVLSPSIPSPVFSIKDLTMDMSANFSGFQDVMGQAQAQAQAAFEKSSSMLGEAGDFAKGNVEAMIESSKIFADGVQDIGSTLVAEGRTAFEAMTGDIKELAAAKSPTDFLKLQSDMVRKNFDSAVAYSSKSSETFLKLMNDAFAPLSGRVSLAVDKARQTAPVSAPMSVAA